MKIKISDLMTGEFQPKADRPLDEVRLPSILKRKVLN